MSDWLSEFEQKKLETVNRKSDLEVLSTSYPLLDSALGIGGVPRGKVIDIMGEPSVGKTSLALDLVAEAQKAKLACVWLDLEQSFDSQFAYDRKVNINDLLIFRPKNSEGIVLACETLMKEGLADFIIFDSVSALNVGDTCLRYVINPLLQKLLEYKSSLIFLSQVRVDLENHQHVTPYMNEINDIANIRMKLVKINSIKHQDILIGKRVLADIYKNDLANPASAEIELYI